MLWLILFFHHPSIHELSFPICAQPKFGIYLYLVCEVSNVMLKRFHSLTNTALYLEFFVNFIFKIIYPILFIISPFDVKVNKKNREFNPTTLDVRETFKNHSQKGINSEHIFRNLYFVFLLISCFKNGFIFYIQTQPDILFKNIH